MNIENINNTNININNNILNELIQNQRKDIKNNLKLSYNDLKRINKYLIKSIFNDDECNIWNGYISVIKNSQNKYINFFFNKKKYSLQRLLYINYIDNLENNEYIKYKCKNKGNCCNINHIYKVNSNINNIKNTFEKKINMDNIIVNFN